MGFVSKKVPSDIMNQIKRFYGETKRFVWHFSRQNFIFVNPICRMMTRSALFRKRQAGRTGRERLELVGFATRTKRVSARKWPPMVVASNSL
ncbi:MAG: hypothetical protein KDI47_18820, partial [Gammaproteobacteria bacterium]|nr:hypothetical protein [Gammaproteobacteria bacterium]